MMFILFLYIVIIVMFNVLIAIVSDLYNDVKLTQDVEVDTRRAEAIINAEAHMVGSAELRILITSLRYCGWRSETRSSSR